MISTNFRFDAGSLRLDFDDATIEAGRGVHRLRLPFRYRSTDGALSGRLVQVSGSVRDGDGFMWLGDLPPVTLYVYRADGGISHLGLSLSDHQLTTLDAARRIDVDLHLDLVAVLLGQDLPPAVETVQYTGFPADTGWN